MKIKILKFLFLNLILIFIIISCDKKYDNVIENSNPDYQVTLVAPSDSIQFNPLDSLITVRIEFNSVPNVQSVFCNVYSADNSKLTSSPLTLFDNGKSVNGDDVANDGKYANKIALSEYYPNGIYNIKYFITDESNSTKQVALSTFKFDNGQANFAPVIFDDIVDPDTAIVTDTTIIITSVKVTDQNGLSDIDKVYFVVYRPNGTTSNTQNIMFDDGLPVHGDQTAGDGIYSLVIEIYSTNTKGTYRLEFQAKDRGGKLSNIINHSLLIQ
jgi:hypothetical protein